ncbi:bacteriophage Gp15 family protein [Oceanobacillus sojae]|uniref:bacteriophage Gp15 family protein n=1 Tax=Oceanobacillus sojae TaxID=582851 RepID=UPI0021A7E7C1|nr:bacteriophage Gp15 family protein [Oceanobacillus sojae]MCT1904120.1 bacteriophage Gp15 family protein [Oceanobacillus sojae]
MRLKDPLVTSFTFNDTEYELDMAFDNILDIFEKLEDTSLRDYEKADVCLMYMLDEQEYPIDPYEQIELWNYIYQNFIIFKEKEVVMYDLKGNPMPNPYEDDDGDNKRYIDLEQDAEFIYASFLHAYNINLYEQQGKMHWHEFKALLNGLPSNTIMQRIIQIRAWEPSDHDDSKYKEEMRKLQMKHAISNNRKEVD